MSTKGTVRYDDYLTNLALAYPNGNLIGSVVAPIVGVEYFSDYVFVDDQGAMDQVSDEAEGSPANEVDFALGTPYSYRTTRKALSSTLTEKELRNASKKGVIKLEQRETNKLTHRLKLKHETRVAAILTDTSKVTNTTDVDSVANGRLDESSPTMEDDIITAVTSIYDNTGAKANTIVIPFEAALYFAKLSWIQDIKYTDPMAYMKSQFQGQIMQLVGLPPVIKGLRVVISDGRYNTAEKGQTRSLSATWGKDILIGYVPPRPQAEDVFGILTMQYDGMKVSKEILTNPRGKKIITEWDYDILEADLSCWYLLQNVIG